jgi:glucose-6-phosphate isomerase
MKMNIQQQPLRQRSAFKALAAHYDQIKDHHLRDWFQADPQRGTKMTAEGAGLYFDYSKHRVTEQAIRLLLDLARQSRLEEHRAAMFSGKHINVTEDRAVLHVALRMPPNAKLIVDGQDVIRDVHEVLARMRGFCDRIRSGQW